MLPAGPNKLWQVQTLRGKGSLAVVADRIYVCGNDQGMAVACLEAKSGKSLWMTRLKNDGGNNATPTVASSRVYLLGYRDLAFCLDAATGTNIWAKDLRTRGDLEPSWGHAGAPVIWENLVVCNVGSGVAVNKDTAELVWRHSGQQDQFAAVAVGVEYLMNARNLLPQ